MDLFCRSSARSSASIILLPTAPTPSSPRSAIQSAAETTYLSSRPTMAPPDDEEKQLHTQGEHDDAQPRDSQPRSRYLKLLLVSCCLQFSTISTSLAIGYVIGTAVAPESLTRTYTGGIAWIVVSLIAAIASGIFAFVLWKRLRKHSRAVEQPCGNHIPESPAVSHTLFHRCTSTSTMKHQQSDKNPFRTLKASRHGNIELRGPSRRTSAGEGFEMQLLNSVGSNARRETLSKTPITPVPEKSADLANQLGHPKPRSQIRTDPAAYFRNRTTSEDEQKPSLMPPKIDSSFWRALGTPQSKAGPGPNVSNDFHEPGTPTRRSRSSLSSCPPRNSSHQMSTETPSENLTVVYRPRDIAGDGNRVATFSSNRLEVLPDRSSNLLQADAARSSMISLPKRVSSLGAPTTLTTSPLVNQADIDSVPNFSVPRTPSRPVSAISMIERSYSPVLALETELNYRSNACYDDNWANPKTDTTARGARYDNSHTQPKLDSDAGATDRSDIGHIRPDSTTLPRAPMYDVPGSFPSLAMTRTESDYEPFAYDRSRYDPGCIDPAVSLALPRGLDDADATIPSVVPYSLNSTVSMVTLKPQSSPASPVSSFEPSLYSSQISLRMPSSPSTAQVGSQPGAIDEASPSRRPSITRASSQKTSTDRLSFKSARTTLQDEFDDVGNIRLRLWSGTSMYEGT